MKKIARFYAINFEVLFTSALSIMILYSFSLARICHLSFTPNDCLCNTEEAKRGWELKSGGWRMKTHYIRLNSLVFKVNKLVVKEQA